MAETKKALVTGAGSGIGRQIAQDLSRAGFDLYLLGRDMTKLKALSLELETKSVPHSVDLAKSDQVQAFIKAFSEGRLEDSGTKPRLDLLINNAGVYSQSSCEEATRSHWQEMFEINLMGPAQLTAGLIPFLKETRGSIVNVASTLGIRPMAGTGAYSASKAAMINWTQSLALELASFRVRANVVAPGLVETPIHKVLYGTSDTQVRAEFDALQPLGRVGQPRDISGLVSFLSQPEAEWITGSVFKVDGGINLRG